MATLSKLKAWISAMRLRTLPLSLSGVIVGAGLAKSNGSFDLLVFLLIILATLGLQILSNLANDYGDGVKGTDNDSRIGPDRAVQLGAISPNQMFRGIVFCAFITAVCIITLIYLACYPDHMQLALLYVFLGSAALVAAIRYTMGQNPYGYKAFGDLMVFVFFGLVSVMGSYLLFAKHIDIVALAPACVIGFLSVSVLNLNNMRDMNSDRTSNKRTVALLLGLTWSKRYHAALGFASLLSVGLFLLRFDSIWPYIIVLVVISPLIRHYYLTMLIVNSKDFDPQLKVVALSTFALALSMAFSVIYF